ncbi:aldehyde dehydrogenase family protein [Telluria aromaticivorans]|uniref:Aldehyde dehydrogenase family protein n=1 Tax=Telluria aromaticivorans TaxID=2725995 RepID=A0A7Y2JXU1_9BURK|nr:aldehyde dehydrogenase family protein [Telluria aromaticivorans]NNG22353.1 aldehyde dehydrogenase family protein [Telluria aromaticivorans]
MKQLYIAGRWLDGTATTTTRSPSDRNDVVGEYASAGAEEAALAVAAAHAAAPGWALSGVQMRADALDAIGSELLARKSELGTLLAREEGKTLPEAIGEVARAGAIFKFYAQEALRVRGDRLASVRPGVDVDVTREPVGVVGIIAPWNFPIAIPAWKIAPALAYGNTVVFKPAEIVPGSAWALAEIISRAGLPPGVFNLAMGPGRVVGEAMLNDARVHAISFTGSTSTGERVMLACARRRARVQLEMGGKNPLVVLADADLDVAVNAAIQGSFFSTGQRCTASSRLIVDEAIYGRFVDAMAGRMAALKVGNALEQGIDIGPVVDASQLEQDLSYIGIAKQEGARLVCGGERLQRDTEGYFLSPALFADCAPGMRHAREEIFGPVASVIPAKGYEHALALANDTEFGLTAGICTTSLKHATHFKRHAKAGMVMVNLPTAGVDYHVPFGGTKASSYGPREQGSNAVEFFATVKTSYTSA